MPRTIVRILLLASAAAASIICLEVGKTATATWTDSTGKTCSWEGIIGENFGVNEVNHGNYSCNGRCGAACDGGPLRGSLGNAYTQDCWSHDICSWFNNAEGGPKDPNCGNAFDDAQDDYLFGISSGCGSRNPNLAPQAPMIMPFCV